MPNSLCKTCTERTQFIARREFPGVMSAFCYARVKGRERVAILERNGHFFLAENLRKIDGCPCWTDRPSRYKS